MDPSDFRNTAEWKAYDDHVRGEEARLLALGLELHVKHGVEHVGQTKLGSFVEAWANIAVGFAINFTANLIVLPWFGYDVTGAIAFKIGVIFTVISLVRQYVLRRWFNGLKFFEAKR